MREEYNRPFHDFFNFWFQPVSEHPPARLKKSTSSFPGSSPNWPPWRTRGRDLEYPGNEVGSATGKERLTVSKDVNFKSESLITNADIALQIRVAGAGLLVGREEKFRGGTHAHNRDRLRKHPFLLALRHSGRFARRNVCDSATEIPYWWRKICPESGQKRWLVDGVITLF